MLMDNVIPVIKVFTCFDSVRIFYILSVVVHFYVKGVSDFPTYYTLQNRHSNQSITYLILQEILWHMLNFSFVWILSNVVTAIICWYDRYRDVLHGIHSPLVTFCLTFRSFCLWLIVFAPMICLDDVFLRKAMTGVALNTFLNVLLIFNICQCLLINCLIFDKVGLYVTENGITFFRTALVLFNRIDLSRLSTFLIWFWMLFSLYPVPRIA